MELFSLRQVLVPGVGWALVSTWSLQVKVGWVQDIPQVLVGFLVHPAGLWRSAGMGWSPSSE